MLENKSLDDKSLSLSPRSYSSFPLLGQKRQFSLYITKYFFFINSCNSVWAEQRWLYLEANPPFWLLNEPGPLTVLCRLECIQELWANHVIPISSTSRARHPQCYLFLNSLWRQSLLVLGLFDHPFPERMLTAQEL